LLVAQRRRCESPEIRVVVTDEEVEELFDEPVTL
jgi:hypothetical protein